MKSATSEFPIYRKYPGNRAFFKLLSKTEFEEISFVGKNAVISRFEAKTYPDRLRIADMIEKRDDFWEESSAEEYEKIVRENKLT